MAPWGYMECLATKLTHSPSTKQRLGLRLCKFFLLPSKSSLPGGWATDLYEVVVVLDHTNLRFLAGNQGAFLMGSKMETGVGVVYRLFKKETGSPSLFFSY